MNVELLRKVEERILATPARFNMEFFGIACLSTTFGGHKFGPVKGTLELPVCNTQCCIGGEAVLAAEVARISAKGGIELLGEYESEDIEDVAQKVLGLTYPQKERLFYFSRMNLDYGGQVIGWPTRFYEDYNLAKTATERAKVAVARIEHFIATNGEE